MRKRWTSGYSGITLNVTETPFLILHQHGDPNAFSLLVLIPPSQNCLGHAPAVICTTVHQYFATSSCLLSVSSSPHSKPHNSSLTGVAQLVGRRSANEMPPVLFLVRAYAWVAGSVPSQGACRRQLLNVSLSH